MAKRGREWAYARREQVLLQDIQRDLKRMGKSGRSGRRGRIGRER